MIDELLTEVLEIEGWPKYTNDPADHGGPTKGGITLAVLSAWRKKKCTAKDVQELQEPEARAIFAARYVYDWKFDLITDAWVQWFVVDTGVLQGQEKAAKMLQGVLHVPADGKIGPVTLASLSMAVRQPARLRKALIRERMHLLLDAMVADVAIELRQTTNLKWRHGWWNRTCDFIEG